MQTIERDDQTEYKLLLDAETLDSIKAKNNKFLITLTDYVYMHFKDIDKRAKRSEIKNLFKPLLNNK